MCPESGENEKQRAGKPEGQEKKDRWDKAKIFGSISTAFILAFGAIMGSIFIPDKINRNSLQSQKIIQLSELVPQLYDSTKALRPTTIAMASYGAPAVPFLLLALDDAIENDREDMIETIVSTVKYMEPESKARIRARLKLELDRLDERSLTSHNLQYIDCLVSILEWPGLEDESVELLREYFSVVNGFSGIQYKLNDLNARILRALCENGFEISRLKLEGLGFEGQDLRGIDFSGADLSRANLMDAKLYDCKFRGAILDSCILFGARFFATDRDTLFIVETFREFAQALWGKALLDPDVAEILRELENDPSDADSLLRLATEARENIF